jgi:hypothetical protein
MATHLLVTSIPSPVRAGSLQPARLEWTQRCIRSWLDTNHRVLSLNEPAEGAEVREHYGADVTVVEATRSTRAINGKPLIYILDALRAGIATDAKRVSLCNADVVVTRPLPKPWELDGRSFFLSNRLDVEDLPATKAEFFGGIDYVNVPASLVAALPEAGYAFGMPWWDYWLPMEALKRKLSLRRLVDRNGHPVLIHKKHANAWNWQEFRVLGQHFFSHAYVDQDAACSGDHALAGLFAATAGAPEPDPAFLNLITLLARTTSQFIQQASKPCVV